MAALEPERNMTSRTLEVDAAAAGARLDRLLADAWPDLSRSRIQSLIRDGRVTVDGAAVREPSGKAAFGTRVVLVEPEAVAAEPRPERMALAIVHEDGELLVLDKPAGLVVHPGAGHGDGTLVNALLAHCGDSLSGIGGVKRPGIVHRLDKNTSGLLVVAKTDRAHAGLSAQFADHGRTGPLERAYLAFAWGLPDPRQGMVDAALARATNNREKMTVVRDERGRRAVTRFQVEEIYVGEDGAPAATLLRCRLETGRTHQIRVHLAHLNHPVIGDGLYGAGFRTKAARLPPAARAAAEALGRQALHAELLQFSHPATGAVMRFQSALPPDLDALRAALRGDNAPREGALGD